MRNRNKARRPRTDIRVRTVHRERWRRTLVLTGEVEGVLAYEGMSSGERVYFDGRLWATTSVWSWRTLYPYVEFDLPGERDEIPARIDVAGSLLPWKLGITEFKLTVDGTLLYEEEGRDVWFLDGSGVVSDEPYEEDA